MGSMYRLGIAPHAEVGDAVTHQASEQLKGANTGIQGDIKAVVKQFPPAFTAVQIERQLDMGIRYGKAAQVRYRKGATRGLQLAIDAAEKAKAYWHPKAAEMYVFRKGKNKEWQDTYNIVMRIYVEVAGFVAEGITLDSAKQQLQHDLNPVAPKNIGKYVLIGGAAFFGYRLMTGKPLLPSFGGDKKEE